MYLYNRKLTNYHPSAVRLWDRLAFIYCASSLFIVHVIPATHTPWQLQLLVTFFFIIFVHSICKFAGVFSSSIGRDRSNSGVVCVAPQHALNQTHWFVHWFQMLMYAMHTHTHSHVYHWQRNGSGFFRITYFLLVENKKRAFFGVWKTSCLNYSKIYDWELPSKIADKSMNRI